jgi:hypothetical protein
VCCTLRINPISWRRSSARTKICSLVSALQRSACLLAQADRAVFPESVKRSLGTGKAGRASFAPQLSGVQNNMLRGCERHDAHLGFVLHADQQELPPVLQTGGQGHLGSRLSVSFPPSCPTSPQMEHARQLRHASLRSSCAFSATRSQMRHAMEGFVFDLLDLVHLVSACACRQDK